jgi:hypothetical protein
MDYPFGTFVRNKVVIQDLSDAVGSFCITHNGGQESCLHSQKLQMKLESP